VTETVRERVAAAFAALLDGLEDRNGDAVPVVRGLDTGVAEAPLLAIEEGAERYAENSMGQMDVTLSMTVYGFVHAAAEEGDPEAAGPGLMRLIGDLHARVAGRVLAEPRQLGGIAMDMRLLAMTPGVAMDAAVHTGGFTAEYEILYQVDSSNLFSQATGG
jgi:hypothetical protein